MQEILRWRMPRAYKIAVVRLAVKMVWRGWVVGTIAVFVIGGLAVLYLRIFDPVEAQRLIPLLFLVATLPLLSVLSLLRMALPMFCVLTITELRKDGERLCKWQQVERYEFGPSEVVENLRVLKIKVRGREHLHHWTFDPAEVAQSRIAQVFDDNMNPPR